MHSLICWITLSHTDTHTLILAYVLTAFDLVSPLWPASLRPLRVCVSPDSAAQQFWVMGCSWGRWEGGGRGLAGCIISRFHCPGTGVLNQPQVADKRIWIESQRGPLPAAACWRWRSRSRPDAQPSASVGQDPKDWWGRRKPSLTPILLSLTISLAPSSPWVSQGNGYFEKHRLCVWKGIICSSYDLIHDEGTVDESGLLIPAWQVHWKQRFTGTPLALPSLPHL